MGMSFMLLLILGGVAVLVVGIILAIVIGVSMAGGGKDRERDDRR
jgi:hypothetical protein